MVVDTNAEVMFEGTGAEILVESLCHAGIGMIFGVPGDTGIIFYDALYHRRDRLRHVLARDERHAAIMADVYARCTNTVGVVEASSGGGVTYLASGLGEPYASSVPMLVITSDIHRRSRSSGAITEIDQRLLFAAVTKWLTTVEDAADIPRLVAEALMAATSGRPGPVCLVVPEDVFDQHRQVTITPMANITPYARVAADAQAIHQAADALRHAERPAIVSGGGIHLSGAWKELGEMAASFGIPVATTIHGKGTFAETSPWSLGVVGANGARAYANEYVASADVVLFIGTRANSSDTNGYTSPPLAGATIIHNDIDLGRAGRNYPGSIALVGDARATLQQLIAALSPGDAGRRDHLRSWIANQCQGWHLESLQSVILDGGLLNPRDVVRTIHDVVDAETLVLGDAGTPTPNLASYWEVATAARSIMLPRGHGSMGWAIPGAIGAAFAHPGRPVIALTTDGSLAMACGELETACRFQLPIVFVQFTNGSLGWIKMLQHLYLDRRYFGVEPGTIDAVAVARGMGLQAARVSTIEEFARIFREGLAERRPMYIDVPVPEFMDLVPPVASWQATLAGTGGRPVY